MKWIIYILGIIVATVGLNMGYKVFDTEQVISIMLTAIGYSAIAFGASINNN